VVLKVNRTILRIKNGLLWVTLSTKRPLNDGNYAKCFW